LTRRAKKKNSISPSRPSPSWSGLQDSDVGRPSRAAPPAAKIQQGIASGKIRMRTCLISPRAATASSAEQIYVNRKVLDLVTKAEMETRGLPEARPAGTFSSAP